MKKPLALLIIILIINLPIAIASDETTRITDEPRICGNNNINSGEECDPPFSQSHKYNPEPCVQKLKDEGKTDKEILKIQHFNSITCDDDCTCKIELKNHITPWKPLCGNNVIDEEEEECDPTYSLSKIINPQQCINKYKTANPDKTDEEIKNFFNQQKTFCNNACECQNTITQEQIINNSDNISLCGNYNLEQRELCDPTAANGVSKCEAKLRRELRLSGLNDQQITQRLSEIDHFECSTSCNSCIPIEKPPEPKHCGNNIIDEGENCDPPGDNTDIAIQQCKEFLFVEREWDQQKITNFVKKHNIFCTTDPDTGDECVCMYEEKEVEIDCGQLLKQIQQNINEYFTEEKLEKSCAIKEWIKESINELNKQTNCQLNLDKMFNDIDKKCQKHYEKQEGPIIKKIWNGLKKGVSYLIPKWMKRSINWLFGGTPCSNGTDRKITQHGGCSSEGQACLYEPELSYLYPLSIWEFILNKITGWDMNFYVWGRCNETCNCIKDDDYNNKVNEFIERFKQEIQEQETIQ